MFVSWGGGGHPVFGAPGGGRQGPKGGHFGFGL